MGMGVAFFIAFILVVASPPVNYIYSEASKIYRDTGDYRALKIQDMASNILEYLDNLAVFLLFASPISIVVGGILLWRSRKAKKKTIITEIK